MLGSRQLVEFVVLDIEPLGQQKGRYFLAEATVARASDMGSNDSTYYTRTHLGGILHVGDSVLGYHMTGTNFNNELFDKLEDSKYASTIPDVMLVKKHYVRTKKSKSKRNWRLKRMAKEESEMLPRKPRIECNLRIAAPVFALLVEEISRGRGPLRGVRQMRR